MTRRAGRPPVDPAKVEKARAMIRANASVTEAAEAAGISKTALYEAIKAEREASRPAPTPGAPVASPPVVQKPQRAENDHGSIEDDLQILTEEIESTRELLEEMRREGSHHGMATLTKVVADLIKRRGELRPPVVDPEDEERRWRADAESVIRKITVGLKKRGL